MTRPPFHVPFLRTGHSACGVLAESLLNHWRQGRFGGFGTGKLPKGNFPKEDGAAVVGARGNPIARPTE
jgi:hypothetical protein